MKFRGERLALAGLAMAAIGLSTDCARSDSGQTPDPKTRIQLLREVTAEAQGAGQQNPNAITARQVSVEQPPEPGWNRFRSLNFPYQTYVPPGWRATSGRAYDHFGEEPLNVILSKTQVIITVEDLKQPITLEDYGNNMKASINPAALVNVYQRRVGGVDAWLISADLSKSSPGNEVFNRVVLIRNSQAWEITLKTHASVAQKEVQNFQKMLDSLTFT